jgi:flagellar motility protein MotE (MotC chaperone)
MKAFPLKAPLVAAIAALLGIGAGGGWYWMQASGSIARIIGARRLVESDKADKVKQARSQGWDFWTIEIENLAAELADQKAQLHKRTEELDQRAARLAAEGKELDRIRTEVEAMRREIDDRVVAIRSDEAKNLRSLSQTYTNLSPHAVVIIFRETDDATAVKILSLMKPEVVGPIFEDMARSSLIDGTLARRAATLSDKLRLMKSGVLPPTAGP